MGKLKSEQIKDGEVKRDDINVDETGQAVIRKIIAGTGVIITSTGVDAGTGDVTIQATGTAAASVLNLDGGRSDSIYLSDLCIEGGTSIGS